MAKQLLKVALSTIAPPIPYPRFLLTYNLVFVSVTKYLVFDVFFFLVCLDIISLTDFDVRYYRMDEHLIKGLVAVIHCQKVPHTYYLVSTNVPTKYG
jgi:hypothetical protein